MLQCYLFVKTLTLLMILWKLSSLYKLPTVEICTEFQPTSFYRLRLGHFPAVANDIQYKYQRWIAKA